MKAQGGWSSGLCFQEPQPGLFFHEPAKGGAHG
jgi:hypothetical protein